MRIIYLQVLTMLFLFSCRDDTVEAGAKGKIEIGDGSCAQPIDYSSRVYFAYTGKAYFVQKTALDSLGAGSLPALKHSSDSTDVSNGKYTVGISPGNYYLLLEDPGYGSVGENLITIYYERVTEQDFKFWKCTSY